MEKLRVPFAFRKNNSKWNRPYKTISDLTMLLTPKTTTILDVLEIEYKNNINIINNIILSINNA